MAGIPGYQVDLSISASHYFAIEFLLRLSSKWECASQESIKKDSEGPHVNLAAVVLLFPDELGRHVRRSSAEYPLLLSVLTKSSEAKVNNFDHVCFVFDEKVVQLDISVSNALRMQVLERLSNLLKISPAYVFLYLSVDALVLHVLMQRDPRDVVSHDADLFAGFNQVVHPDYVWVIDLLESHDLPLDCFPLHAVIEFDLLIYFDGALLHRRLVITDVHDCESPLSNCLSDLIAVERATVAYLGALL